MCQRDQLVSLPRQPSAYDEEGERGRGEPAGGRRWGRIVGKHVYRSMDGRAYCRGAKFAWPPVSPRAASDMAVMRKKREWPRKNAKNAKKRAGVSSSFLCLLRFFV